MQKIQFWLSVQVDYWHRWCEVKIGMGLLSFFYWQVCFFDWKDFACFFNFVVEDEFVNIVGQRCYVSDALYPFIDVKLNGLLAQAYLNGAVCLGL